MVFGELVLPEIPRKKKKKDKDEVVIPPQAIPVEVQIRPGEEVQIPLRVYGWRGRNVKYLLRNQPKDGEVQLVPGSQGNWTLVYRHGGAIPPPEGAVDRFFYAAQDYIGTSPPAEIRVKVVDFAPQFEMPGRLAFGQTWTGEPLEQTITVANRGGGVIVGRLYADAPWRVEPEQFQLKRGEEREMKVIFEPTVEQAYQGRITVSGEQGLMMQLSGMARDAFRVEPTSLDLLPQAGSVERVGKYSVENRTQEKQTIAITADPRLALPESLELQAGEKREIAVRLGEDDLAELKSVLVFSNGTTRKDIGIAARPIGARLFAGEAVFGKLTTLEPVERKVTVSNRGGTAAAVAVTAPPGVSVAPQRFDLEAGAEQELTLVLQPEAEGTINSVVRVQSAGSAIDLPVTAEVALEPLALNERQLAAEGETPERSLPGQTTGAESVVRREGDPSVPVVASATLRWLGEGRAELKWKAPQGQSDLSYQVETQRVFTDIDGTVQIVWQPVPGVQIEKNGAELSATVGGIPPGGQIAVQIVTVSPEGKISSPSATYTVGAPPRRALFTWRHGLLAFFALLAGGALWARSGRGITLFHSQAMEEKEVGVS